MATWRERIAAAQRGVEEAYEWRANEFRVAHDAGLSFRQIAEAAGMTAAGVHKIVGITHRGQGVSLDSEVS